MTERTSTEVLVEHATKIFDAEYPMVPKEVRDTFISSIPVSAAFDESPISSEDPFVFLPMEERFAIWTKATHELARKLIQDVEERN